MGKVWASVVFVLGACAVLQAFSSTPAAEAQLSPFYYLTSCPLVFPITAEIVHNAILNETRIAGSLLRLHFHDCFVHGCDASLLLTGDGTQNSTEQNALPNFNSARGYPVLDDIKTALEETCPGVVSCADITALAAFFSVVLTGGPIWPITLGRRDSLVPFFSIANDNVTLPSPFFTISQLIDTFSNHGHNLSLTDLVALSGGHTIGRTRCAIVKIRLYGPVPPAQAIPDLTLNATLESSLKKICHRDNSTDNVTLAMDASFGTFDNSYFKKFLTNESLFESDNALLNNATTNKLVHTYATNQLQFFVDFAQSMFNMGNLHPLTGTQGEIRQVCSKPNPSGTQSVIKEVIQDINRSPAGNIVKDITAEEEEIFKNLIVDIGNELGKKRLEKQIEESLGIHSFM